MRWACVFAGAVVALLAGLPERPVRAAAQDSIAQEEPPAKLPLRFRRVYAPAERVDDWPRGSERYVPVDGEEFERLVKAAQEADGRAPPSATLDVAQYEADFSGDEYLSGSVLWEIGHHHTSTAMLRLAPLNLALATVQWRDGETPVEMGLADDGHCALAVDHGGTLSGRWSLHGRRDADGRLAFRFELPQCALSTMRLTVPRGVQPVVNSGQVSLVGEQGDRQTYQILPGGHTTFTLRLAGQTDQPANQTGVVLREVLVYDLTPRGLDLAATWKLDVRAAPLRELKLLLDPGLNLVSAQLGDAEVPFAVTRGAAGEGATALLALPEPLAGSDRPLRLAAIASQSLESSWKLPRIRAADALWQEGTCTLLVREPLVVNRLLTRDCRQTKYSILPEPNRGESFDMQLFNEAAAIEVALVRQQPAPLVSTGMRVELGAEMARAEVMVALQLASGHRRSLEADVAADWIIDSVDAVPREALAAWRVNRGEDPPRLIVDLARPLLADAPLKLVIRGHRLPPDGALRPWQAADLSMLDFRGINRDDQLLTLRPSGTVKVSVTGAENLPRFEAHRLSPSQAALFAELPRQPVYRFDPHRSRFAAVVDPQPPVYSADLGCEVTVQGSEFSESYALHCLPQGERIARVLVRFSQPRNEPLRWQLVGEKEGAVLARRLSSAELRERRLADTGEIWDLTLVNGRTTPFDLTATRTVPFGAETLVSLVALPEADSQQGKLLVRAAADVDISISASGMTPLDPEAGSDTATERAAFRYLPADSRGSVTIARNESSLALPAAVAWHRRVESRYDVAGNALHRAMFRIRNAGESEVTVTLPEGSELARIWLNGEIQATSPGPAARVALSADRPFVTLIVEYRAAGQPLASGRSLRAPLAAIDLPTLTTDWLLWLPLEYELSSTSGGSSQPAPAGFTWSQRLLGPLGRTARGTHIDATSQESWAALFPRATRLERSRYNEFLAQLSAQAASAATDEAPRNWGDFVNDADSIARQFGAELLVDAGAVGAANIHPRTPLRVPSDAPAGAAARNILHAAGLTLVATPQRFLLTSRLAATIDRSELQWIDPGVLAAVNKAGPLRALLDSAAAETDERTAAAAWATREGGAWETADFATPASDFDDAMLPCLVRSEGPENPEVQLRHKSSVTTIGVAVCILVLATCVSFLRRATWLVIILPFVAAVALIVPDGLVPATTGSLWGLVLALVWCWLAPTPKVPAARPAQGARHSSARAPAVATSVSLVLLATVVLASAAAQSSDKAATPGKRETSEPIVHRVFVPVDDNEQPTKDKYQVPEQLYDELRLRGAAPESKHGFLIRAARYRLSLGREGSTDQLTASDIAAHYEVLVLRPDALVRLPASGIRPSPKARRDDRAVDLEWDSDEDGFFCRFDEPGTYELEVSLRPPRGAAGASSIELAIPPVPQAMLEVQLPTGQPVVDVPSALGAATLSPDGRKLTVALGPTERLAMQWGRGRQVRVASAAGEVDAWLWLQIQPASVILHARLEIKGIKTPLTELWLSVDPRLRPLPVVDRSGAVASVQAAAGDPQSIRVQLARPVTDEVTIPVSFLLIGSSGVGQISLPRVTPQGMRLGQRVLAVSVDPALVYTPPANPQELVAVPDFLAHWGGATAAPQFAMRLGTAEAESIATRPRDASTTARQRLSLSVGEGRTLLRFDAQIGLVEGQVFAASTAMLQHYLQVPRELEIEKISLVQDGIERVNRWTREGDEVTVFLTSPASGRQQIALTGWLPAPREGVYAIPQIDLASATRRETSLFVYRQPAVQVTVEDRQGLVEIEAPRATSEVVLPGRLVAALAASADEYGLKLRIAPNRPRVRSVQVTSIALVDKGWEGRILYRANVEDGALDAFAFKLPADWVGPFEATPPATLEIVSGPGNDRQLIVRPKTTIEASQQIIVRSALAPSEKPVFAVPTLVAGENEETTNLVALPTTLGGERTTWETTGMQDDQLPDGIVLTGLPPTYSIYRVNDAAVASCRPVEHRKMPAELTTAQVNIAWSPAAATVGVATFKLHAPNVKECQLHVPEGMEILSLQRSGLTLTPQRERDSWRIPLSGDEAEQAIRVVFRSAPAATSLMGVLTLRAPSLTGVDVSRTDWLVCGPADAGRAAFVDGPETLLGKSFDSFTRWTPEYPFASAVLSRSDDRFSFPHSVATIVVRYAPDRQIALAGRSLSALLFLLCGAILTRAAWKAPYPDLPILWPALLGVLAGLLAWAWIMPAWPGLVLAVASGLICLWPLRSTVFPRGTATGPSEPAGSAP